MLPASLTEQVERLRRAVDRLDGRLGVDPQTGDGPVSG